MIKRFSRRQAIGDFLRKHRQLCNSETKNSSLMRRRRTPGLRREEVADLAGISETWYTRLEQGKEMSPSATALSRIAKTLRLEKAERVYLFDLAGRVDPENQPHFGEGISSNELENCVSAISSPAYLLDKYWTPRFWNDETAKVFSVWLDGPEINLLRHMFLDPAAQGFVTNWEIRARQLLAQFRSEFAKYIDDPKMIELVANLSENSELFRNAWDDQHVEFREGREKLYNHEILGQLKFHQNTFLSAVDRSLKLVVLSPIP